MERSADVVGEAASFRELLLPEHILSAILGMGFVRPSPVQQQAIPLARLGADVIAQAKAGTGKTLVFAVAAVEKVDLSDGVPQVLVLAPTREVALQASEVITAVAARLPPPGLCCGTFIGGLPIEEDERCLRRSCQVAVGTPGRVLALLQRGALPTSHMQLLVLDEADKLLAGESFKEDVEAILGTLPDRKQVLALSATLSEGVLQCVRRLMRRPREVMLCSAAVALLGIRQMYQVVSPSTLPSLRSQPEWRRLFESRQEAVLHILGAVSFHQAVVFCNWRRDAEELTQGLASAGYPSAYLSAAKAQLDRIDALNALRDFRLRVAVTTDLVARGIDLDRVNLVVNLDLPVDAATYAHRVGRAGRFGSRGVAVTLVTEEERVALEGYLQEIGGEVLPLPEHIPPDWYAQQISDTEASKAEEQQGTCEEGTTASGAALPTNGGLKFAFSDISTASLWYEDVLEDLPSSTAWPPQQNGEAAVSATSVTPPTSAVGGATAAGAALPVPPRQSSLLSGSLQRALQADQVEGDAIDLRYTVVDSKAPADQRQGGHAKSVAAGTAADSAYRTHHVLGAASRAPLAGSSDSDSWASTSDDVLSSSSCDESQGIAVSRPAPATHVSRVVPHQQALPGRPSSNPSAIPMPRSHLRHDFRHHHHAQHHSNLHSQENGSLSNYVNSTGLGAGTGGDALEGAATQEEEGNTERRDGLTEGSNACQDLLDAQGPVQGQAGTSPVLQEQPADAAVTAAIAAAAGPHGEEEYEHSFRDSWLRDSLGSETRCVAAQGHPLPAPTAAASTAEVELRPHPSQEDRGESMLEDTTQGWGSLSMVDGGRDMVDEEGNNTAAMGDASATLAAEEGTDSGTDVEVPAGQGGRHYWQVAASARVDLLSRADAAQQGADASLAVGESARLLKEAFRLEVPHGTSAQRDKAWAATSAEPQVGAASGQRNEGEGEVGWQVPVVNSVGTVENQLPPPPPPEQLLHQGMHGSGGLLPVADGLQQRRPLGSAQADAARQRAQQEQHAEHGRSSLVREAALLEAWAEEDSVEEADVEGKGGGWKPSGPGSSEQSRGSGAQGGSAAGNEEAWRQYYLQYYQYYGCYPAHFQSDSQWNPSTGQPGWTAVAPAAKTTSFSAAAAAGWQGAAGDHMPPPPPPPHPPLHPQLAKPLSSTSSAPPHGVVAADDIPQQPGSIHSGPLWGSPWESDSEGYVQIPAEMLRRYQEAEWRDWQRRYREWCWVWEQWCSSCSRG